MDNSSFNSSTRSLFYSKTAHVLIMVGLASLLSACAFTEVPTSLRPGQGNQYDQLELRGEGYQQFKCVKDNQGYYWQYLKTEALLYPQSSFVITINNPEDAVARMSATTASSQTFTHKDGSKVRSTRVLKHIAAPTNGNIQWMRMAAQSGKKGTNAFDSIRYILRVNTY